MTNHFTFADSEYVRELQPVHDYIDLQTFYLAKLTGKDEKVCREFVISQIKPDGQFPLQDPKVTYLSREESRDRVRAATTLLKYISNTRRQNHIFVPSWTTYFPSNQRESLYTGYIEETSKNRSRYKKAMFIAEQRGDEPAIKFNDGMQSSAKISINSISGAALATHTINHTQSLHQTLTGVCAALTAMANLNNEKLIAGNRMYASYQATLDNISVICIRTDLVQLEKAMLKFNIHYPNPDEVMACINESTQLYWRNDEHTAKLRNLVVALTPLERAAVLYVGDMYHLDKHNPQLVEAFLAGFTYRTHDVLDLETSIQVDREADGDVSILAKLLCKEYLMGTTLSDLKAEHPEKYGEVCANMVYINKHLDEYEDLIKGVFRPSFLSAGANRYSVPNMLRKAVLTSDTDSTIYTAQYWVKRIAGSLGFEDKHYAIGFAISFLVNKTVYHQLAMLSKNMGFEDKHLHTMSMKNEYYFPVYALTNQTKNYFAFISVREGNVYTKMKLEKKGVGIRSSKIPRDIMSAFDGYITYLMNRIIEVQNITLDEMFEVPYRTEVRVRDSIVAGRSEFFQTAQIKHPEAYKQGHNAPALKLHRLWETVFADKYGTAPDLPYMAVKVSTLLTSAKKTAEWINSFDDPAMAAAMRSYLKNEDRRDLGTIYVPQMTVAMGTIPPEIMRVIDVNKQIMNVMSAFYLTLESFGFYLKNPHNTTMIHNHYKPPVT